jgi:potassium inwardly-rectifying channel subfamily J
MYENTTLCSSKSNSYNSLNDYKKIPINEEIENPISEHYKSLSKHNSKSEDDFILSPAKPRQNKWAPILNQKPNTFKRMIDRDGEFNQSKGKFSIRRKILGLEWRSLYSRDWFHSLVNAPTARIVTILLSVYLIIIIFFSALYYIISRKYGCNLMLGNFLESFLFSLETMATIGYGTSDVFFDDCWTPAVVLTCQVCMKLVVDAIVIGVIYCRLARPQGRASTVLFSNHAIIRRIRGKLYFMFQLCELRKHQLVEAHVRLYVIKHEVEPKQNMSSSSIPIITDNNNSTSYFQTCSMRLNHPNDELGGMLLLCLPQLIVHELDVMSPLMPPPTWFSFNNNKTHIWNPPVYNYLKQKNDKDNTISYDPEQLSRLNFPSSNKKDGSITGDCNNNYNKYYNNNDQNGCCCSSSGLNVFMSTMNGNNIDLKNKCHNCKNKGNSINDNFLKEKLMTQMYMQDRRVEIVAVVEGCDQATGGSVQARHSFTVDEIFWDKSFKQCVFVDKDDGAAIVDFSQFHEYQDCSLDSAFAGVIPSSI